MKEASEIDQLLWLELFKQCNEKSVFQSPEYAELVNATAEQSASVFAIEEDGRYAALVLVTIYHGKGAKGFFSRRGIIYGSPLFISNAHLEFLMTQVIATLKSRVIYLECRNYFDLSKVSKVFDKLEFQFVPYLNFEMDLNKKTIEELMNDMNYNRKRQIMLSIEHGATARCAQSLEEVKELYQILVDLYNTRVKLPLPSFEFFKNIFLHSKVGHVVVVVHHEKIIGGAFNLYYQDTAIYSMYYCGVRNYHKKIFPTHLAILETMKWAQQQGCQWLDFMGAGKKGEEYGVRKYKEEFGGRLTEYGRYLRLTQPLMYQIGQWGLKALSKIKK